MAHTSKCQHHESQFVKCLPSAQKVESWLYNNCYPIDHHNLRSNKITTESSKQAHPDDDDESSVDTTKYIKSNRTITRTKITSKPCRIKHYCYLSATVAAKTTPKHAAQRNSRRSVVANVTNPSLVPAKQRKQRRVRYKTATSAKLAVTIADSSSGDEVVSEAPMIANRFSRRIAKRQKLIREDTVSPML